MDGFAPKSIGNGPSASDNHTVQNDADSAASKRLHAYLKKQMVVAKRRGGWFRLEKRERSMYSLALRLNTAFKGFQLLRAMVGVLKKLLETSDAAYSRLIRGVQMAWAFASRCAEWGNLRAKEWRSDLGYAKYLGAHMCGAKSP